MSDTPHGEGWWIASDGRWYPPESHPDAQPTSPPPTSAETPIGPGWWIASDGRWYPPPTEALHPIEPPAPTPFPPTQIPPTQVPPTNAPYPNVPPYGAPGPGPTPYGVGGPAGGQRRRAVSSGLAKTLQGFLYTVSALSLFTMIAGLVGLSAFNEYWDSFGSADSLRRADDVIAGFIVLTYLAALVVFVLIIIWGHQAYRATEDRWTGPRPWSAGWTIAAWFIPLANAILPKLVFNDIEKVALAPRGEDGNVVGEPNRTTIPLGWVWWVLFVVGTVIAQVGGALYDAFDAGAGTWRLGYAMISLGYLTVAVAAVTGALYIRRISNALGS